MDEARFDDLTRSLAGTASRRWIVRRLAGVALGAALAGLGLEEAAAKCVVLGKGCKSGSQCCSGFCQRHGKCTKDGKLTGKCKCRCPTGTTACGSRACCGQGQQCQNGACAGDCVPEDAQTTCGAKVCGDATNNLVKRSIAAGVTVGRRVRAASAAAQVGRPTAEAAASIRRPTQATAVSAAIPVPTIDSASKAIAPVRPAMTAAPRAAGRPSTA